MVGSGMGVCCYDYSISMPSALLVSNLVNLRYITNVEMTFGMLLFVGNKRSLFVDSRYIEKAKKEASRGITVLPIDDLEKHVRKIKSLLFEADDVTVSRLQRWKKRFRGTRLIPSMGVVEEMRRMKSWDEIRAIRRACKITDHVMKKIPHMLKVGRTEKQVAWEIEKLAHELGADAMSFDTIVGFGPHTARPHHSPTHRKLTKRDIVQIDMGVKVDGYCSDCSRVFFVGKASEEERKVFNLLAKTVKETTQQVKAGMTNHALDRYARTMLGSYEPYFTHGLGHGVGLEIHEGMSLSKKAGKQVLKTNEIITIEPGIYLPGKWGMRIEDTILVTKNGSERLTKAPFLL